MAEIKEAYTEFTELNTDVYGLSTDFPEQSGALSNDMKLPFELLCDPERSMLKTWDLLNPFEHGGVAVPAIIIINTDGVICFMSVGGTATRTRLSEILEFLRLQNKNSGHKQHLAKEKRIVIPGPSALWQLGRNFIFQGNAADWRHFFLWPFGYVKKAGAAIVRKASGFR